jgi:hypothetical protein
MTRLATVLIVLWCCLTIGCRGEPATPAEGKARPAGTGEGKGGPTPSKFSKENWAKIKAGMSRDEVTELVGPPTRVHQASGFDFLLWEFSEQDVGFVMMKDGKVTKIGNYGTKLITG